MGLEISLSSSTLLGYAHRNAESETSSVPGGPRRSAASVGGQTVTGWHGFVGRHGVQLRDDVDAVRATYAFTEGQTMVLRPQATDGRPLRVIVSPEIARSAGPNGSLLLDVQGTRVPAAVVGVADRFPDAQEQGEGSSSPTSRDFEPRSTPTCRAGTPAEVWLAAPIRAALDAALGRAPFTAFESASRFRSNTSSSRIRSRAGSDRARRRCRACARPCVARALDCAGLRVARRAR